MLRNCKKGLNTSTIRKIQVVPENLISGTQSIISIIHITKRGKLGSFVLIKNLLFISCNDGI